VNIKALRQKKADIKSKLDGIVSGAEQANRDLTDAERVDFDALMAQMKTVNSDIERAEAMLDEERNQPAAVARVEVGANRAEEKPWASLGEQLLAVKKAAVSQGRNVDPRLHAALGSNEQVDAEGGFLVAPEFSSQILQRTYEEGQVTSRCNTMPMSSNRLVLNALDEDSRVDGQRYGGIQVYRISEAAIYTGTKPRFRQLQLNANKLIGLFYGTEEILDDAPALESWVNTNFPKAFAFQLDNEVINGSGAGQMLGVLNSGAAIVVAEESSQATATVVTANILKMYSRLWAPSRKNAVWWINQDVEQQLYSLTLGSGTAVELLYTPPGMRGNNNDYGLLMGRPVIPIEQAATLGTQGDIILADQSQYIIGQRSGMRADSSIHVQFTTGEETFRWMLRNDGQPIPKKPLTPYKGTNTLSPFVTLAARP
jgi:HK97 family phage major capsid protein